jgi:hypothetical protein
MIVYLVYRNADLTEGRGPDVLEGIFKDREVADEYAMKLEPYGFKNQFCRVKEEVVHCDYKDFETYKKAELRKRALSKLTEEERKVLGV